MRIELVIARGHTPKLLAAAEKALDRVALRVARRVVGPRRAALAPGRNHGTAAACGQPGHERVRIVTAVGHDIGRSQSLKQRQSLWGIVALACAQATTDESPARIGGHMYLTGQAAAAAPQGLRPVFLRAPDACWCARTVVESSSNVCKVSSCCTAAKTLAHTPLRAQRWNRVYVVCQLPHATGSARHRQPLRASHSTASTKRRLSVLATAPARALPARQQGRDARPLRVW